MYQVFGEHRSTEVLDEIYNIHFVLYNVFNNISRLDLRLICVVVIHWSSSAWTSPWWPTPEKPYDIENRILSLFKNKTLFGENVPEIHATWQYTTQHPASHSWWSIKASWH